MGDIRPLGDADAVFTGKGPAHGQRRRENLLDSMMDPLFLFGIAQIAENGGVDVAVAGVAVYGDGELVFLGDGPDAAHHFGEGVSWDGDILSEAVGREAGDGGTQAPPDGPQLVGFLLGLGDAELEHIAFPGHGLHPLCLRIKGLVVLTVDFNDDAGANGRIEVHLAVPRHGIKAELIHDLGGRRHDA